MAEQFTAWRAKDGSIHETEDQARSAEAKLDLEELLMDATEGYDRGIDWFNLKQNREGLIDALTRWQP